MAQISEDGVAFLKLATAAPDFESVAFDGIPDNHAGPTITVKSYVTSTVTAAAGNATYFILTPQGDVAFWKTTVPTGTDWINGQDLDGVLYPKAATIFDALKYLGSGQIGGSNTEQVSKGRCVSSAGEMVCLNNAFNQYGSITAWKVPLSTAITADSKTSLQGSDNRMNVMGITGVNQALVGSTAYTAAVRDGVYSTSMNREGMYDFHPVMDEEHVDSVHQAYMGPPSVSPGIRAKFNGPMCIFDNNFDSIIFRVDVPEGVTDQSFLMKRWCTFEYEPIFNSLLYDTSNMSPPMDPAALALYSEIGRHLPLAVGYRDNPDFWDTVLQIVDVTSSVLSSVPGPVGAIASGVHAVATALEPGKRRRRAPKKKKRNKNTPANRTKGKSRKGKNRRKR
jgi:hypothetical protein